MASKAVTAAYQKCIADALAAKEAGNPMSAAEQRHAFNLAMAEAYRHDAEHGSEFQEQPREHHPVTLQAGMDAEDFTFDPSGALVSSSGRVIPQRTRAEVEQWQADRSARMAALHGKVERPKIDESARNAPTFGRRVAGNPAPDR